MNLELHQVNSLERAAYTTLYLLQELQYSSAQVSAMTGASSSLTSTNTKVTVEHGEVTNSLPSLISVNDSELNGVIMEKSRFLMKLAPRIRRLESETAKCLVGKLEELLACIRNELMEDDEDDADPNGLNRFKDRKEELLLMIGNCLRGLALLGKGVDAESAFARVAIM